jgi:RNA polymerase sigma factor (sigma-70 family)
MTESPSTHQSLLVRLRDAHDGPAWAEFVEIYAPLVYRFVRKRGLQDADAADLTQDVMGAVAKAIQGLDYETGRGSFRGWLFTIARNRLRNFITRRKPGDCGAGDTDAVRMLQDHPAPAEQALWDEEYDRQLFACAAKQVRGRVQTSTWQAFWLTSVEGKSGQETAAHLDMTVAAVYLAKSRVMAQLKECVDRLREE